MRALLSSRGASCDRGGSVSQLWPKGRRLVCESRWAADVGTELPQMVQTGSMVHCC